jgi:hypothetical protein
MKSNRNRPPKPKTTPQTAQTSPRTKQSPNIQNTHNPRNKGKSPEKYKTVNRDKIRQIEFLQKITFELPEVESSYSQYNHVNEINKINEINQKKNYSETNKNVGILFWYLEQPSNPQEIQILTGIETSYLTDKMVPEIKRIIEKYQVYQIPNPNNQNSQKEIHEIFSERAKLLSKELKKQVYYDQPIEYIPQPLLLPPPSPHLSHSPLKNKNKQPPSIESLWRVQYRVANEKPKWGIIKGSMKEHETCEEAIQREIQEELFPLHEDIPMNPQKIIQLPNPIQYNEDILYTFHYQVTKEEKEAIERNVQKLQELQYGELVTYEFRTLKEIFTAPCSTQPNHHSLKQYFNGKSRMYIKEFYEEIASSLTSSPPPVQEEDTSSS